MPYAYRKSAGRFGEDEGSIEVNRPPSRPSASFPNARPVIDVTPMELYQNAFSSNSDDPILAQRTFDPNTICNDDVSSLGNDNTTVGELPEIPLDELLNNPGVWEQVAGPSAVLPAASAQKRRSVSTPALGVQVDPGEVEPPEEFIELAAQNTPPVETMKQDIKEAIVDETPAVKPKKLRPKKKKEQTDNRRSVTPEKRERRKKKKQTDGSLVSTSDPSMSPSRRDKETKKKRVKKKGRPSPPASSTRRKHDASERRHRRKSRETLRDPRSRSSSDQNTRRRSKSRHRTSQPKQTPVTTAEIKNFVSSSDEFLSKANESKDLTHSTFNGSSQVFEDIPLAPVERESPSLGNKIMSQHFRDFDETNFSPRPFAEAFHPPSIAMTLNPELPNTSPKASNPVITDDEEDDEEDYDIGNSLEHAISSKPRSRPERNERKKRGQGTHLLQKMFGGGGTLRRDTR